MIRLGINHNCELVRVVLTAEIFEAGAQLARRDAAWRAGAWRGPGGFHDQIDHGRSLSPRLKNMASYCSSGQRAAELAPPPGTRLSRGPIGI
jgi:hypothetical protein